MQIGRGDDILNADNKEKLTVGGKAFTFATPRQSKSHPVQRMRFVRWRQCSCHMAILAGAIVMS